MSFICDFISRIDEDDEDEDEEDEVVCRTPPQPMFCLEDNDVEILEEEVE